MNNLSCFYTIVAMVLLMGKAKAPLSLGLETSQQKSPNE